MARHRGWKALLALVALLVATPALAGGWAVVTLDTLPTDLRAEQSISLGFVVRQHGDKPVDVHTWNGGSMPFFAATNTDTGETLRADARKEGALGHYIVDVRFPSAGTWNVEIVPEPFAGTDLGTFTVAPAASTNSTLSAWAAQPAMRWAGGALGLAALGLALWARRGKTARRVPALGNQ